MATATAKIAVTAEDRTKKAFNNVQNSLKNLDKSFGQLKAGIGALVGIGGVGAFATQMVQTADKIGKVSSKLGISTDALQKFRFGAEQSGVATSTFDMAIQRMTRRVAEAREGTGEAKKALEEMGISLRNSSGRAKTTEEIFLEVADVMKGMTSQSDKVRLSFKLFDSEGVSLVNMMQQGSTAIKDYGEQLEAYGGIIDQKAIKATEDFNDALNILQKQGRGIFSAIVLGAKDFIEALEDIGLKTKEVFDKTGKMNEGLSAEDLVREYKRLNKEIENLNLDLAIQQEGYSVINWLLGDQEKIDKKIAKIQSEITEALLKQYDIEESMQHINVKQVKGREAELDTLKKTSKLVVEDLSNSKAKQKLDRARSLFSEITLENEKQLYQVTLRDTEGKGEILGVVKGLTKEQAEQLVLARQAERVFKAQEKARKVALDLEKKATKQLEENKEIAEAFVGGIRSASSQASRFFNAVGLQIKEVGNSIELAFSTNWLAIITRFAMSSKKVMGLVDKVFSTFGGAIDNIFNKLLPGIGDANELVLNTGNNISKVLEKVEELGVEIDDYNMTISGITGEAKEMALIEKQYLENRQLADDLGSGFLTHVADLTKQQAILARTTERVARATEAFKQSASSYITALETAGFTDLQKDLFLQSKGFITGPMKIFSELIKDSKAVLSIATARLPTAQAEKTVLQEFMDEKDFGKKKALAKQSDFLMSILGDQLAIIEKGVDRSDFIEDIKVLGIKIGEKFDATGFMNAVARYQEAVLAFGKVIPDKAMELLNGEITSLTSSIELQNGIISTNTDLMNKAQGGLLEMVKETIRSEHESGKSKESILADIDVVSAKLKEAGLDIASIKAFVGTLTTGAMGGLVKRYPYGGSIHGPSHAGGGVKTELEGGEYVMRKSAVSQYGQDFMNQINSGRFSMGQPIQVSIYDGTGQAIDEYDSAIRVEINQRANRFNQFPSLAN